MHESVTRQRACNRIIFHLNSHIIDRAQYDLPFPVEPVIAVTLYIVQNIVHPERILISQLQPVYYIIEFGAFRILALAL